MQLCARTVTDSLAWSTEAAVIVLTCDTLMEFLLRIRPFAEQPGLVKLKHSRSTFILSSSSRTADVKLCHCRFVPEGAVHVFMTSVNPFRVRRAFFWGFQGHQS